MNRVKGACVKTLRDIRGSVATCEQDLFEDVVLVPKGAVGVVIEVHAPSLDSMQTFADVLFRGKLLVTGMSWMELAPASPLIALALEAGE